jgi:hypothetical protein
MAPVFTDEAGCRSPQGATAVNIASRTADDVKTGALKILPCHECRSAYRTGEGGFRCRERLPRELEDLLCGERAQSAEDSQLDQVLQLAAKSAELPLSDCGSCPSQIHAVRCLR